MYVGLYNLICFLGPCMRKLSCLRLVMSETLGHVGRRVGVNFYAVNCIDGYSSYLRVDFFSNSISHFQSVLETIKYFIVYVFFKVIFLLWASLLRVHSFCHSITAEKRLECHSRRRVHEIMQVNKISLKIKLMQLSLEFLV